MGFDFWFFIYFSQRAMQSALIESPCMYFGVHLGVHTFQILNILAVASHGSTSRPSLGIQVP